MSKKYTYEEVLGDFKGQVERWKNDSSRVPGREQPTKESILLYAGKVYQEQFRDSLHPSVLDQYK